MLSKRALTSGFFEEQPSAKLNKEKVINENICRPSYKKPKDLKGTNETTALIKMHLSKESK